MLFKRIFFTLFFCLISSQVFALANRPKHYVVLVHGIASTPDVFGYMQEALEKDLNKNDQKYQWIVKSFSYETGNNQKDVFDFSRELSDFTNLYLTEKKGINPETKFSLVMHSQGGIVGLRMLLEMHKNNTRYHPHLLKHLDAFLSIGTPYWGAKMALFGSRLKPVFDFFKLPFKDKFGALELKDMEVASDYSALMRRELLEESKAHFFSDLEMNNRTLIVSGMAENLNILSPLFSGKTKFEDDFLVPLSSSRLDFIYYVEDERGNDLVSAYEFNQTNFLKTNQYKIVNALHISPFEKSKVFRDLVHVPEKCLKLDFKSCEHSSYQIIVNHLLDREQSPEKKRPLTSFAIDVKIVMKSSTHQTQDVEVKFISHNKNVILGKAPELYHFVRRLDHEGNLRIYRSGEISFKSEGAKEGEIVEIQVVHSGRNIRTIHIPVKVSHTSYVEIVD